MQLTRITKVALALSDVEEGWVYSFETSRLLVLYISSLGLQLDREL